MARNGSGMYSLPAGSDGVSGTTIQSSKYNAAINDIATGLTESLPRNGSAAMTADLPMGGFKISGMAAGAASGEAVEYAQMNTAIGSAVAAISPQSIRQTVLNGPVTSTGSSNFGGSTGSTTVTATGSTLLISAAGGISITSNPDRLGSITSPSWTALSTNGTMYLYVEVASDGTCTTGSTILAPIYQDGGTPSVANNQHTFVIADYKMYVGDGTAASQKYRVFVGDVTVSGGVVTAINWYAIRGKYNSGWFSVVNATTYNRAGNIGVDPIYTAVYVIYRQSSSYSPRVLVHSYNNGTDSYGCACGPTDIKNIRVRTGSGGVAAQLGDISSIYGANDGTTLSSGQYCVVAQRTW